MKRRYGIKRYGAALLAALLFALTVPGHAISSPAVGEFVSFEEFLCAYHAEDAPSSNRSYRSNQPMVCTGSTVLGETKGEVDFVLMAGLRIPDGAELIIDNPNLLVIGTLPSITVERGGKLTLLRGEYWGLTVEAVITLRPGAVLEKSDDFILDGMIVEEAEPESSPELPPEPPVQDSPVLYAGESDTRYTAARPDTPFAELAKPTRVAMSQVKGSAGALQINPAYPEYIRFEVQWNEQEYMAGLMSGEESFSISCVVLRPGEGNEEVNQQWGEGLIEADPMTTPRLQVRILRTTDLRLNVTLINWAGEENVYWPQFEMDSTPFATTATYEVSTDGENWYVCERAGNYVDDYSFHLERNSFLMRFRDKDREKIRIYPGETVLCRLSVIGGVYDKAVSTVTVQAPEYNTGSEDGAGGDSEGGFESGIPEWEDEEDIGGNRGGGGQGESEREKPEITPEPTPEASLEPTPSPPEVEAIAPIAPSDTTGGEPVATQTPTQTKRPAPRPAISPEPSGLGQQTLATAPPQAQESPSPSPSETPSSPPQTAVPTATPQPEETAPADPPMVSKGIVAVAVATVLATGGLFLTTYFIRKRKP